MPKWNVEKFRRICDAADGAHAAVARKAEAMSEARAALGKAQMFLRESELTAATGRGVIGVAPASPYSVIGHAPGGRTLSGRRMVTGHDKQAGTAAPDCRTPP